MHLLRFDLITGRVISHVECSRNQAQYQASEEDGVGVVEAPQEVSLGSDDYYVSLGDGKATARVKQKMSCDVEITGFTAVIAGIPPESLVSVEDEEVLADGKKTEIEFDAPGTYEIRIYPPPQYRDEVLEVTVG